MNRYLIVTGANGYLGKYLIEQALQDGYHVLAFKFDHIRSTIIQHPNVEYIYCDITKKIISQNNIKEITAGKNIIGLVNAAAILGCSEYDYNYKVNAEGVKNIIDFCKELNINKVVHVSSVVVLKKIKGPYGITKLKGQQFLMNSDINYTIFIPAMILGPENLGINRVLKNVFRLPLIVPIIGSGMQTQHPVFVKDFAKYIIRSIENPNSKRKVYEIGGNTIISFKDLVKLILKIKNRKKIFIPVPVFVASMLGKLFQTVQKVPAFTAEHVKGVLQDSKLNTDMLKEDLDFKPTPLEKALKYTLKEIDNNWDSYLSPMPEKTITKS